MIHSAANLNALYKEVYAEGINNLIPDGVKVSKMAKFSEAEKVGEKFVQPVCVSDEQGFTYGGSDSDAFTLNESVAAVFREAEVDGKMMLLRTAIGYSSAAKMVAQGPKSFAKWSKLLFKGMVNSMAKRREIEFIHGRTGLGVVSSSTKVANGVYDIVLTTASWAGGIWAGSRNARIDFYAGSTKRNSTTDCVISSISSANKRIRVSGLEAELATIAGTDVIYFKGAYGKEAFGLHGMIRQNGSIFNIDNQIYDLWKGVEYPVGGAAFSFAKVMAGIATAADKGLESDVVCVVNNDTFKDLNSDLAALRHFDSSYKVEGADVGNKTIKYHGQTGLIEIVPSIYQKAGQAWLGAKEDLKKIGSTDITFEMPGQEGGESTIFRHLENQAGYEVRCFSEFSPFCDYLGRTIDYTGIVNT